MKEYSITANNRRRYLRVDGENVLNPDRVDRYYVRGKNKKDCLEILNTKVGMNCSMYHFSGFALMWGTFIERPKHEGRGLWLARDANSTELIEVWIEE
jgi:hypothetical protein